MGIEQAFGFGREAEIIYVGQRADYRPYEKRIAYLEGQVEGYKKAYDRDIAELKNLARQNKDLAERNRINSDLWVDTLRELVAKGRTTREEVNTIRARLERHLPSDEAELLERNFHY